MDLAKLGWNEVFANSLMSFAETGLEPARVALVFRGGFEVWGKSGQYLAQVSGRFRHNLRCKSDNPVTGDFVLIDPVPGEAKALIQAVLPRRTSLSRAIPGRATEQQVLATNIDLVFIAASLTGTLRTRTLERYLTLARESGASPIILLTKTDLCENVPDGLAAAHSVASDVPVIPVSSLSEIGLLEVKRLLPPGSTAVILGPSGVGKSTLINALCGEDVLPTTPVREDDQKGRHTTTEREMILIPGGGLIIDSPGLREIQIWEGEEGLADAFPEITALSANCRFSDCQHETEPGCAIRSALQSGQLPEDRFEGYQKLRREMIHFEARYDIRARNEERRKSKQLTKDLRNRLREKGRDD